MHPLLLFDALRHLKYNKHDVQEQLGVTLNLIQQALPLAFTTGMSFDMLLSSGAVNMWDHMALIRGAVQNKIMPPICRVMSVSQTLLRDFKLCNTLEDIVKQAKKKKEQVVDTDDLLYSLNFAAKHSDLGINGMAEISVQKGQSLRNKLAPGDVSHQLTLADFLMVLRLSDDTDPIDVLCRMFGGQFISRTDQRSETITQAVLKAMSEHGDIADALNEVMSDGVIDDAELARLHREITQARNALIELENTVNRNRS